MQVSFTLNKNLDICEKPGICKKINIIVQLLSYEINIKFTPDYMVITWNHLFSAVTINSEW
jgi:hypothetical protein